MTIFKQTNKIFQLELTFSKKVKIKASIIWRYVDGPCQTVSSNFWLTIRLLMQKLYFFFNSKAIRNVHITR